VQIVCTRQMWERETPSLLSLVLCKKVQASTTSVQHLHGRDNRTALERERERERDDTLL
jgi:hypothetical protein